MFSSTWANRLIEKSAMYSPLICHEACQSCPFKQQVLLPQKRTELLEEKDAPENWAKNALLQPLGLFGLSRPKKLQITRSVKQPRQGLKLWQPYQPPLMSYESSELWISLAESRLKLKMVHHKWSVSVRRWMQELELVQNHSEVQRQVAGWPWRKLKAQSRSVEIRFNRRRPSWAFLWANANGRTTSCELCHIRGKRESPP